jgi:hypothetical protein
MQATKPTDEKIDSEITKLKDLATKVVAVGLFGNNNRAAIEAQVHILEKRLSHSKMWDFYGEDSPDYSETVFEAAMDAISFLRGEFSEETLSEGWEPLAG